MTPEEYVEFTFGVKPHPGIRHIKLGKSGEFAVGIDYHVERDNDSAENDYSYQELTHKGKRIADNDPQFFMERHRSIMERARGHIIVFGLGLGDSLNALLKMKQKSNMSAITVVEKSKEVIELVRDAFEGEDFLYFVQGDASQVDIQVGSYDVAYYAIWDRKPLESERQYFLNLHRDYFDESVFIFD